MDTTCRPLAFYAMRAVRLLAFATTLCGAIGAVIAAIMSVDGACSSEVFEVIINTIPIAQLLLLKSGLDRNGSSPRKGQLFYVLAILCLVPQAGAAFMCWG